MQETTDPELKRLPLIFCSAPEGTGYNSNWGLRRWLGPAFDLRFVNPHRYYTNKNSDSFVLSHIPLDELSPMLTRMLIESREKWQREKRFWGQIFNKLTVPYPGYVVMFGDVLMQILQVTDETIEKTINPKAHYAIRLDRFEQLKASLEAIGKAGDK